MCVRITMAFARDINVIRENYDTSNPIIAEILKAKEEQMKILQELNKEHQEDFGDIKFLFNNKFKKEKKSTAPKKSRKSESNVHPISVRRSKRLRSSSKISPGENELWKSEPKQRQIIRPPNDYGSVPGVEVGTHWETRMECSLYGVHRPVVAGIHGGPEGAYSIALSGGYPEDIDEGNFFIYTGSGGRDLKGTPAKPKNLRMAPQTKDQQLEGTNLSLVKSIKSKLPVRVIRGYKSPTAFAPETGYRYDGLYQVVDYWEDIGKTGHRIYRFKMERMKDQNPPPWETNLILSPKSHITGQVDENFDEFSFDDESEFKENVIPNGVNYSLDICVNYKEVKAIDNEIQMCIDFFCKITPVKCSKNFEDSEEEFNGWDLEVI